MRRLTAPLREFFEGLEFVTDPRDPRGTLHPFAPILKLVVIGLVCGQLHPTGIAEFGRAHTKELWRGLGFPKAKLPTRWTLSRVLQGVSVEELSAVFVNWMAGLVTKLRQGRIAGWTVSVDGKAAKGSVGENGEVLMMLNVFVHEVDVAIASWPIGDKEAETTELRKRLPGLLEAFPGLELFLGDAHFANRPLCEALVALGRDYLFRVKGNQPSVLEALETSFTAACTRPPDVQEVEKKGALS